MGSLKRPFRIARTLAILTIPLASACTRDVIWDGGAGDQTDANWSDSDRNWSGKTLASLAGIGGPRLGDFGQNAVERLIVTGAGSVVTYTRTRAGGDFRPRQGVEMIICDRAVWQSVTHPNEEECAWMTLDVSKLTVDRGTFRSIGRALGNPNRGDDGGGAMIFGSWRSDDRKATYGDPVIRVELKNGGKIKNEGQVWFGAYLDHDPALWVHFDISGNSSIDLRGGEIDLDNSGIAVAADLIFTYRDDGAEDYSIDFTGEGAITVSAAGIKKVTHDGTEFHESGLLSYQDLWASGILKWNGSSEGEFGDFFSVSGSPGSDNYRLCTKSFGGDSGGSASDAQTQLDLPHARPSPDHPP